MAKGIHQVIIGASEGDAVTSMALKLRDSLREHGPSEIYARWVFSESLEDDIFLLGDTPPPRGSDALVYHASYGLPEITGFLLKRKEPIVVVYHNLTPWQFYLDHNPEFALGLHWGRHELELIRSRVVLALAVSEFNARDLRELGYPKVDVVPAGFDPYRLTSQASDSALLRNLAESYPNGYVLAVAQLLHHKRIEQLMEAVHLCNAVHDHGLSLLVAGVSRQPAYLNALTTHLESLPFANTRFMGAVSDRELATLFRGARAFLGMSDHEGFCIPPLEAMSFGVPVVIKGAGSVPDTVGDGGLVLPADASPALAAEALHEVWTNEETRQRLVFRGTRRLQEIESSQPIHGATDRILAVAR